MNTNSICALCVLSGDNAYWIRLFLVFNMFSVKREEEGEGEKRERESESESEEEKEEES